VLAPSHADDAKPLEGEHVREQLARVQLVIHDQDGRRLLPVRRREGITTGERIDARATIPLFLPLRRGLPQTSHRRSVRRRQVERPQYTTPSGATARRAGSCERAPPSACSCPGSSSGGTGTLPARSARASP